MTQNEAGLTKLVTNLVFDGGGFTKEVIGVTNLGMHESRITNRVHGVAIFGSIDLGLESRLQVDSNGLVGVDGGTSSPQQVSLVHENKSMNGLKATFKEEEGLMKSAGLGFTRKLTLREEWLGLESGIAKMNTDITASTKPEYPVVDQHPLFTKVVGNFNTLDYFRFITITGISVTVGDLSEIKPRIKGPSMVTGGLIGLMGGFMYAYQNSVGRLIGFFPNDDENDSELQAWWKKALYGYDPNIIVKSGGTGKKGSSFIWWIPWVVYHPTLTLSFAKLGFSHVILGERGL